jgi:hypothetical protein
LTPALHSLAGLVADELPPAGVRVQPRVESARRGLDRLVRLLDEQPVHARLVAAQRAAGAAAIGVRRALHATLVDGDTFDAPGRSAARALDRLQELTRPARAPARGDARLDRRREGGSRSRNGRTQPIDPRRMGFGLPDSSARALASADSSVDALASVIELPLARPETISPELALVDPELARLARARLHEPGLFWPGGAERRPAPAATPLKSAVGPAASWGTPLRTAPAPAVSVAAAELLAERTAVSRADRFFQPPPPRPLVPGGMAAVAAALLVGVGGGLAWVLPEPTSNPVSSSADTPPVVSLTPGHVSSDPPSVRPAAKQPAAPAVQDSTRGAGKPATGARTETRPNSQPSQPRVPPAPKTIPVLPPPAAPASPPAAATKSEARTFAWAPAPGATGYEIQLFRGNDRVLVERTGETKLKIGPRWTYEGRTMSLQPGRYRWYVWPLGAGGARSDRPVVQARVLIGAG